MLCVIRVQIDVVEVLKMLARLSKVDANGVVTYPLTLTKENETLREVRYYQGYELPLYDVTLEVELKMPLPFCRRFFPLFGVRTNVA